MRPPPSYASKAHQALSLRIYVGTQNLFINFMHELCKYGMRVFQRMCIAYIGMHMNLHNLWV